MEEHTTTTAHPNQNLITQFSEITSASLQEATFFLESHNFDLDSAVSTFFETSSAAAAADQRNPNLNPTIPTDDLASPDSSPSRSRSASPPPSFGLQQVAAAGGGNPYNLRSRNAGGSDKKKASSSRIRTFSDLNQTGAGNSGDDSDEPQEYYTGGHKSGMLVQDPKKVNDVDALFNQARQAGAEQGPPDQVQPSSSSRFFAGRGRILSGVTTSSDAPQQVETEPHTHTITFWTNGFTVNDGPLRRLDDPQNASFLESIRKSECPDELRPPKGRAPVHVNLVKKLEEYPVQKHRPAAFAGVGRTLGTASSSDDTAATSASVPLAAAPAPFVGLAVDSTLPSTSIQLRLADGTRMVSRFNLHHTINHIRSFIDASRPGGSRTYQLLTMGFPPKQLNNLSQTIEDAGLANSVVIQKL
uniref:plant UBX domain-containing protein 4 n=1 Tax=Erigeron canadensis TaxID=72917 RepID=UPI001CB8B399|nr:plant UBX domain-containing protein 4 [Erigeron canadensis]